jgi:hypothetical protein
MSSLTKQRKKINRWKKVKAGKRGKRIKRRGTTPAFAVHLPKE